MESVCIPAVTDWLIGSSTSDIQCNTTCNVHAVHVHDVGLHWQTGYKMLVVLVRRQRGRKDLYLSLFVITSVSLLPTCHALLYK